MKGSSDYCKKNVEEGVMYFKLPIGANYQGAKVTKDGVVEIFYTIEKPENISEDTRTQKNKPKKFEELKGGNKLSCAQGYWWCDLKGDPFVFYYFGDLTVNDIFYDENGNPRNYISNSMLYGSYWRDLANNMVQALEQMPEVKHCWIPKYDPSFDEKGQLHFNSFENQPNISAEELKKLFEKYSIYNHSRVISKEEYFLVLLRKLKNGIFPEHIIEREINHFISSGYHHLEGDVSDIMALSAVFPG